MPQTESRLERIEKKLDEVGQAVVALARVEERLMTIFRRMDTYDTAQRQLEEKIGRKVDRCDGVHSEIVKRLTMLERSAGINGQTLRFAERVFWIVATATVALAVTKIGGGV